MSEGEGERKRAGIGGQVEEMIFFGGEWDESMTVGQGEGEIEGAVPLPPLHSFCPAHDQCIVTLCRPFPGILQTSQRELLKPTAPHPPFLTIIQWLPISPPKS